MGCGASARIGTLMAYESPSGGYGEEDDDMASGITFLHDNDEATKFLSRFAFKKAIVDPGLSPGEMTRAMEGDGGGEEYHSDTVVWLALDKSTKPPRKVAVKVVRIRSRAFLRQFRKECKTMQKATKKQRRGGGPRLALATFVAAARSSANTLVASEYIGGGELFDLITSRKSLPDAWAARIAGQLLSAFAMLHPLNVIHFDLKPENVLLAQDAGARDPARDPAPDAVLIDFGESGGPCEGGRPGGTTPTGTPGYAAPELQLGKGGGKSVDVWGCGALVFTMLMGRPPVDPGASVVPLGGLSDNWLEEAYGAKAAGPPAEATSAAEPVGGGGSSSAALMVATAGPSGDDAPQWGKLSEGARAFMQACMQPKVENRVSVADALELPWIVGGGGTT